MSQQDRENLDRWASSARYWDKHREIIRQMFAPVSEALIAEAEIKAGDSVLDVATGQGEPALRIAEIVGPNGEVVGIDPVAAMIEAARREAGRLSLRQAKFENTGADKLPFPDDRFDAVVSRFGIMFFASPVAGAREMLRVLKPGKQIAFAVWSYSDSNPFHSLLAHIVDPVVPPPPVPPDAPDAFRFAEPGRLKSIIEEAGAAKPVERLLRFSIDVPLTAEGFWDLRMEMSEKLRDRLAAAHPDVLADLRHRCIAAFQQYATKSGLSFPGEVLVVSAKK